MWIIKMVVNAFALFAVPVVTLVVYYSVTSKAKATGIALIQAYGPFFVLTGLFYVAFGAFLWSPLPVMLLRHLVEKHLGVQQP